MPTSLEDLIQAGLETADCEKNNNFNLTEKTRIANESISAAYDFVVTKWESYFASSIDFSLPSSNVLGLAEITTGIPEVPAWPVAAPAIGARVPQLPGQSFALNVRSSFALQYFVPGGTTSFSTPQGTYKPPAGRVLQLRVTPESGTSGTATTVFTILKNGVPVPGASLTMSPGRTSGLQQVVNEDSFGAPVHFNGEDTLDISAQEYGTPSAWSMICDFLYQLDQPASLFYKELGLTRTADGYPETIEPLTGYPSRNQCQGRRYWLQGQTLSLWPQIGGISHAGAYTLDYVPNCPVLVAGGILPPELERWKELISVLMGIKFMTKRRQPTDDLERRQAKLEAGIIIAAGSRKAEVRKLRPLYNHDQFPGCGRHNIPSWRR